MKQVQQTPRAPAFQGSSGEHPVVSSLLIGGVTRVHGVANELAASQQGRSGACLGASCGRSSSRRTGARG